MFQAPAATKIPCELCGNLFLPVAMVADMTEGELHLVCPQCYNYLTTCHTCRKAKDCKFETDPSPIQKIIQRTYRQGPMTSVVQEKNPERIAITCQKGCDCYEPEKGCLREIIGWCDKYACILRKGD